MSHGGKLDAVGNSLWPQLWAGNPMLSFVIACASSWLYGLHILPHTLYRMLQIYINTPEKVEQLGWFIQAVRSKIIIFFFFYYFLCLNHHVFVCLHQPLWRREATTSSSALPSNIIPDNSDRTERGFKLSWNATGSCVKGLALIQNMSLAAGTTIPRSLFDPDLQPLSESVLCRHFGDAVWRYCVHPGAAKKKKHLRFKSLFLTLDSQQRQTTIFF